MKKLNSFLAGFTAVCFMAFCMDANATKPKEPDPEPISQLQAQQQEQAQAQEQYQAQLAKSHSEGGSAVSSNDGVQVDASDQSSVQNNSSNTVLVPNNNTENCLRVIGIAWGKGGESGALGWPYRSKKCDYEQAADDAFAAGERETGWFWKCENPSLYKSFRGKGESVESAKSDCLDKMVGNVKSVERVKVLEDRIQTLLKERDADRKTCNESKDRIVEACQKGQ